MELQGGLEAETQKSLDELMKGKKLLILDYNGTIDSAEPRYNLKKLLKYCRHNGIKVTISTDASKRSVFSRTKEKYLQHYVDGFYGANYPGHIQRLNEDSEINTGIIKNFEQIMKEHNAKPEETLVVGDTKVEELSAKLAGAPYYIIEHWGPFDFSVLVPKYNNQPRTQGQR